MKPPNQGKELRTRMLQWMYHKGRTYYAPLIALGIALLVSACSGGTGSSVTSKSEVGRVVRDFVEGFQDEDSVRVSRTLASQVQAKMDLGYQQKIEGLVSKTTLMQALEEFWREYYVGEQEFEDPLISVEGTKATAIGEYKHTIFGKDNPELQCSMKTTAKFALWRGGSSSWELTGIIFEPVSKGCQVPPTN